MTRPPHFRRLAATLALAVVAVLGAAVGWSHWTLRQETRAQILDREGRTLLALVDLQRAVELDRLREMNVAPEALDDVVVALQTTRLAGVVALRLQKADGQLVALPSGVLETPIARGDFETAAKREPVVRFHPRFTLVSLFDQQAGDDEESADCVEIVVRVSASETAPSVAQYWIDGRSVAEEFARFDRELARRALLIWAAATLVIGGLLGWAVRRVEATTQALERANRELALAAKTSALGAVAAHLMHGLRNPLSGLRGLAKDRSQRGQTAAVEAPWSEAVALTERLQSLVDEVTQLLRDETDGVAYSLTAEELRGQVERRVAPVLKATQVTLTWSAPRYVELDNRRAGLVALVLANLVQNAAEASPPASVVEVTWAFAENRHEIDVLDHGPGLPAAVRPRLFSPVTSSRPQGAGIGLAISRQLAAHAGGGLELLRSDASGTVFRVSIPVAT